MRSDTKSSRHRSPEPAEWRSRDIPAWIAHWALWLTAAAQSAVFVLWPGFYANQFNEESGFVEIATNALGLLADVLGASLALRPPLPILRGFRYWFAILALGMVFFVGEEVSWGQHVFGWSTPGAWADLNRQQETNLHNLAGNEWFDTIPRSAVVYGILAAAIAALSFRRRGRLDRFAARWNWFVPTGAVLSAAALVFVVRMPRQLGLHAFPYPREQQELYIAAFFALYMGSVLVRSRHLASQAQVI